MSEMQLDSVVVGEVIARCREKKGLTQEVAEGISGPRPHNRRGCRQ